jgi:hypothetical protein
MAAVEPGLPADLGKQAGNWRTLMRPGGTGVRTTYFGHYGVIGGRVFPNRGIGNRPTLQTA